MSEPTISTIRRGGKRAMAALRDAARRCGDSIVAALARIAPPEEAHYRALERALGSEMDVQDRVPHADSIGPLIPVEGEPLELETVEIASLDDVIARRATVARKLVQLEATRIALETEDQDLALAARVLRRLRHAKEPEQPPEAKPSVEEFIDGPIREE